MAADVEKKMRLVTAAFKEKALPEGAALLENIKTSRPLELLCMDYLMLEANQSNTKDILVLTDHFTKYALALPAANPKGEDGC